jgi:bifunctional non-homologous end joining protein LigD
MTAANVCADITAPELLTLIQVHQAGAYVFDPQYAMQPKRDGERLLISSVAPGRVGAFNKLGEPCAAPPWLAESFPQLVLDGELERRHRRFVVFDLLQCVDHDLRPLAYSQRLAALRTIAQRGLLPECCRLIDTWFTAEEKEKHLFRAVAERWEGVVFKRLGAPYRPGRAGQHLKLKFVKMCTVRVRQVEPTSARIEMLHMLHTLHSDPPIPRLPDPPIWIEVCGVSLVGRPRVKVGDYLEVKYLYATNERNGAIKLVQPVMLRLRDDVTDRDCGTEQLIFKNTEVE